MATTPTTQETGNATVFEYPEGMVAPVSFQPRSSSSSSSTGEWSPGEPAMDDATAKIDAEAGDWQESGQVKKETVTYTRKSLLTLMRMASPDMEVLLLVVHHRLYRQS